MYTPGRARIWIPAYTGVRQLGDMPAMADLPVGVWAHRVMLVGGVPVLFGGYGQGGTQLKRSYRLDSGTVAPVRMGDLNLHHAASNSQQGMGWVHNSTTLQAWGDPLGGAQQQCDILTMPAGTWATGFLNPATHGLSGVTPVLAQGYALPFLAWGDSFSINERLVGNAAGQTFTALAGVSPLNPPRPYQKTIFRDGRYIWAINGSEGVAGQKTLVRIDTNLPNDPFLSWTTANGCFQQLAWNSNGSCGTDHPVDANIFFIFGGVESPGTLGSNRAWMLDTLNPLVPYTLELAPMPRPRVQGTCHVLDNGLIAVIGGGDRNDGACVPTAAIDLYDPGADAWYSGPNLPEGVWYHSSVKLPSGNVLIAGGNSGGVNASNKVRYLDKNGFSLKRQDD